MSAEKRADRLSLTNAQRQVIDSDEVAWVGWDARHRPVVSAYYYAGFKQSQDPSQRRPDCTLRTWAVKKDGDPTEVTEPIERRPA